MSVVLTFTAAAGQVCSTAAECANQGVDNFVGTPKRVWAGVAALVSLVGVVAGASAWVRSARRGGHRGTRGAVVALAAGLLGGVNGAVDLAVADGGPGSGNGVVGAAAAAVLGVVAVVLGLLVLTRSRRPEPVG
ncbi:hypothetical protein FHX81_0102 [Saccharothrix saharensis]|uniref:Uncharacterized protein n=1 Tax=Saccharothrix saharensis TaxID=571190 RepID=A0A543J4U8_9PSEU|nr:DUF6223 family protein [Saccharothrix saharensis]TQM77857.1 hypothetical protein FHX81_0102 [Saccharothrix saharensis]